MSTSVRTIYDDIKKHEATFRSLTGFRPSFKPTVGQPPAARYNLHTVPLALQSNFRGHLRFYVHLSGPNHLTAIVELDHPDTARSWGSLCSRFSPPRVFAAMGFVRSLIKRIPSTPALPSLEDLSNEKDRFVPRLSFFKRRIRLKGNSKISVPLGAVLLFPCIVIILIVVLIVRHPSSPGGLMMPAGAPPAIR